LNCIQLLKVSLSNVVTYCSVLHITAYKTNNGNFMEVRTYERIRKIWNYVSGERMNTSFPKTIIEMTKWLIYNDVCEGDVLPTMISHRQDRRHYFTTLLAFLGRFVNPPHLFIVRGRMAIIMELSVVSQTKLLLRTTTVTARKLVIVVFPQPPTLYYWCKYKGQGKNYIKSEAFISSQMSQMSALHTSL